MNKMKPQKKTGHVSLRLNAKQNAALEALAKHYGETKSFVLRHLIYNAALTLPKESK